MKGLLVKDLCLLKQQKKTAIMFLFISLMLSFSMDSTFLVSYIPMVSLLLAMSTVSNDSFDNGMPFLMSLPASRKDYAIEKYVLTLGVTFASWVFAILLQFASLLIRKEAFAASETIIQDSILFPFIIIALSLMLPINLKFGTENGRLILLIIFGIIAVLFFWGKAIAEALQKITGWDFSVIPQKLESIPGPAVATVLFLTSLLFLVISILISIRIMDKKEF